MRKIVSLKWIMILMLLAVLAAGCAGKQGSGRYIPQQSSTFVTVNHQTYTDEIMLYSGPAVVLFYNTEFWQSLDMKRRLEWLAGKYRGNVKFALFHWQVSDDPSRFSLEMLPTVILYRNGEEIDRIKGIPPDEKERTGWNDDLELWFLKNAMALDDSQYSGDFTYLFRNGYTLQVGNY